MSESETILASVPPAAEVRKRLAAATAECRALRRLLHVARAADEAAALREHADDCLLKRVLDATKGLKP